MRALAQRKCVGTSPAARTAAKRHSLEREQREQVLPLTWVRLALQDGPTGALPNGNVHGIYVTFHSYQKEVSMCWVWLFLAISLEVAATVFMKLSQGFSKIVPTAIMGVLYAVSFVPLAIALKKMDVGVAYAVWSAVGTAMVTLVGVFLFKESVSALKVLSIALIITGVVSLNLSSHVKEKRSVQAIDSVDSKSLVSTVAMTSEPEDATTNVRSQR